MHELIAKLYPICRSITGDGNRETLGIIGRHLPLTVHEVPSGTRVFDWTIPDEWSIREAYIRTPGGDRIADFRDCNLHVAGYSRPVRLTVPLDVLKQHLFTAPQMPDRIPYRTLYYSDDWAFCIPHRQYVELGEGSYEVVIDSSFKPGALTYGEACLGGELDDEVLISCHICHPSLCNDNLSGISVAVMLGEALATRRLKYSYRFLFIPGTIGSIAWLSLNEDGIRRIRHGLVLTCLGDGGGFHYKKSRQGTAVIDRAAAHVLKHQAQPFEVLPFTPYGYDERQYCSPGFDLPVGCLMRSVHGTFPEYHTSADNLEFVKPEHLAGSLELCQEIIKVLEGNDTFVNLNPKCEPQLGKRGLYAAAGGVVPEAERMAVLWVLNQSDGSRSLLDVAEQSGLRFADVRAAADRLTDSGLLRSRADEFLPRGGRDSNAG